MIALDAALERQPIVTRIEATVRQAEKLEPKWEALDDRVLATHKLPPVLSARVRRLARWLALSMRGFWYYLWDWLTEY